MAKKKQVTSKVEKRKSVENRCDYALLNGKCGRAMCDNFCKSCPGRTCEDWTCDADIVHTHNYTKGESENG